MTLPWITRWPSTAYTSTGADWLRIAPTNEVMQPVLQRLLEQDQEHEHPDRADQQAEAHPGAGHLLEGEEHRSSVWRGFGGLRNGGCVCDSTAGLSAVTTAATRLLDAFPAGCRGRERPQRVACTFCQPVPGWPPMDQVALYLQDAHPMREGIELVRYAEAKGFDAVWQADSRLVRDAVVPMAAFAATTDRIKIGSGVIDIWTRNAARLASTFSTLDDLAPGRIICGLGAWWDPLAAKVGISRDKPLRVMREVVDAVRGLLANETVYDRRLPRPSRRRRARLRAPGTPAEGRADLHRRDRHADDGAHRRDRRRRGAQLPRQPRLQPAGARGARAGRRPRRAHARRHRPPAARGLLGRHRSRRPRSTARACSSPSTSVSSRTS